MFLHGHRFPAPLREVTPPIISGRVGFTVPESPNVPYVVGSYTADQPVSWSVSGPDAGSFSIDATTGELTLETVPDYEVKTALAVTVTALSAGGLAGTLDVVGTITNVFEAPALAALTLSAATVQENAVAGVVVGAVQGLTAGSAWTMTDTAGGRFAKSGNNVVTGATPTDYETATSHTITLRETLADSPNSPRLTTLTIAVTNVAEGGPDTTAPTITGGPTAISLAENSGAGQVVGTYTANEAVAWSKSGTDAASFSLNASTGVLTLTPNPDFETKASYAVTVVATDTAGNSSSRAVTVTITDVNEVAPTITSPATASVAEGTTYVMTCTASTPVTWSINAASTDAARFTINPSTGVLSFASPPDFENPADANANNVYLVTIRATDAGGLFAGLGLSITVTDVTEGAALDALGPADGFAVIYPSSAAVRDSVTPANTYEGTVAGLMTAEGSGWSVPISRIPWDETGSGAITATTASALPAAGAVQVLWEAAVDAASRIWIERDSAGKLRFRGRASGVDQWNLDLGAVANSTAFSVAYSFADNSVAWSNPARSDEAWTIGASLNGATPVTNAGAATPAVVPVLGSGTLRHGVSVVPGSAWGGTISRVV